VGDLVNLKQFKKRTVRKEAAKQSETNRALYGRTKAERNNDDKIKQRASNTLDQHRIDDGTSA